MLILSIGQELGRLQLTGLAVLAQRQQLTGRRQDLHGLELRLLLVAGSDLLLRRHQRAAVHLGNGCGCGCGADDGGEGLRIHHCHEAVRCAGEIGVRVLDRRNLLRKQLVLLLLLVHSVGRIGGVRPGGRLRVLSLAGATFCGKLLQESGGFVHCRPLSNDGGLASGVVEGGVVERHPHVVLALHVTEHTLPVGAHQQRRGHFRLQHHQRVGGDALAVHLHGVRALLYHHVHQELRQLDLLIQAHVGDLVRGSVRRALVDVDFAAAVLHDLRDGCALGSDDQAHLLVRELLLLVHRAGRVRRPGQRVRAHQNDRVHQPRGLVHLTPLPEDADLSIHLRGHDMTLPLSEKGFITGCGRTALPRQEHSLA